jgi:hypothetical protein
MATLLLTPKEIEDLRSGVADSCTQVHTVGYVKFLQSRVKKLEADLEYYERQCQELESEVWCWYEVAKGLDT